MNSENIREAIEEHKKLLEVVRAGKIITLSSDILRVDEVLIQVAEVWLKLEEWATKHHPFLLNKLCQLLNPPAKSDLERVREWIAGQLFCEADPGQTIKPFQDLLAFLDQLEAEKGAKP